MAGNHQFDKWQKSYHFCFLFLVLVLPLSPWTCWTCCGSFNTTFSDSPDDKRCWPDAVLMLGQRRRRWPIIKLTLGKVIYVHEALTQCRADVGQRRRRWDNISPALGHRLVFGESVIANVYTYINLTLSQHCASVWSDPSISVQRRVQYRSQMYRVCW